MPSPGASRWPAVALAAIGLVCGLSAFLGGFYDLYVWGPVGLVLLAALLALLVAARLPAPRLALVALAGLAGLWLWTLASSGWAESADQAVLSSDRWLLYAGFFAVVFLLLRSDRLACVLMLGTALGASALVAYLTVRLFGADAPRLFLLKRLSEPFGYTNAVGTYLLVGSWPLIAVAERRRPAALSVAAAALAALDLCLVVLTQSRGAIIAWLASCLLVLAFVPGRVRRAWLLLLLVAAVAAVGGSLLDVSSSTGPTTPTATVVHHAARNAIVASLACGAVWALVLLGEPLSARRSQSVRLWLERLARLGLLGVVIAVAVLGAAFSGKLTNEASAQYHAFVNLRGPKSASRLVSGAGHRYDYWRIAWREFGDHSIRGVGGGSYPPGYFRERQTAEDIRQPHSLELQTLSELGVVGAGLLALFVGGVLVGLRVRAEAARTSPIDRGLAVAAGGAFAAWLAHTSVDWMHLIPGLTGAALCAAAVLVKSPDERTVGPLPRTLPPLAVVPCAVVVAFAALMVGRTTLADHYRAEGAQRLSAHPTAALKQANRSLGLNGDAMPAHYLRAAAFARLNLYPQARGALLEAIAREPNNFVSWTLLGDLAVRRGDHAQAKRAYLRAAALNPRDLRLRLLVRQAP